MSLGRSKYDNTSDFFILHFLLLLRLLLLLILLLIVLSPFPKHALEIRIGVESIKEN